MYESLKQSLAEFKQSKAWQPVKDMLMFAFLLLSFHVIYHLWIKVDFYPFKTQVDKIYAFASNILFNQSVWILNHIFGLNVTTVNHTIYILNNQNTWSYVEILSGCITLKHWMHWIIIMTFFRGPFLHKLWYIHSGIIIIHFINVIRIVGLSLLLIPLPHSFHFFHTYIFKPFFYFMIFVMWVIWVEVFANKKKKHLAPIGI